MIKYKRRIKKEEGENRKEEILVFGVEDACINPQVKKKKRRKYGQELYVWW